jgi:low affinity Fe/Cu permease
MAQNHIEKTKETIQAKLDELLTEYMNADRQIEVGMRHDSEFFGSLKYYELNAEKTRTSDAYHKLTNALVAIETYLK